MTGKNSVMTGKIIEPPVIMTGMRFKFISKPDIKQNIDGHNESMPVPKRVKTTQANNCNCWKPIECPLP